MSCGTILSEQSGSITSYCAQVELLQLYEELYTCTSAGTSIHCPLPRLWVGNNMSLQCELWILETKSSVNIPFSLKRLCQMEFLLCDLYKGARANNQIHGTVNSVTEGCMSRVESLV